MGEDNAYCNTDASREIVLSLWRHFAFLQTKSVTLFTGNRIEGYEKSETPWQNNLNM
jgi:hypothetical protein